MTVNEYLQCCLYVLKIWTKSLSFIYIIIVNIIYLYTNLIEILYDTQNNPVNNYKIKNVFQRTTDQ